MINDNKYYYRNNHHTKVALDIKVNGVIHGYIHMLGQKNKLGHNVAIHLTSLGPRSGHRTCASVQANRLLVSKVSLMILPRSLCLLAFFLSAQSK